MIMVRVKNYQTRVRVSSTYEILDGKTKIGKITFDWNKRDRDALAKGQFFQEQIIAAIRDHHPEVKK